LQLEALRVSTTRVERIIRAPRSAVYRALLDRDAVEHWRVPDGMTSQVHAFEPREGGAFRVSLTYSAPDRTGKTTAHTDTYHGHFARLVPDQEVVEVSEFETADPSLAGQMTITYTLTDEDGGAATRIVGVHEGLPEGVSPADNELGWRIALDKLAELVEGAT
jgi:uncharacterized protein YndB with AHSA1/START domain